MRKSFQKPETFAALRPISGRTFFCTPKNRKGAINIKELSSREKQFCVWYSRSRSPREAAVRSGYLFPEKTALKLLRRKEVREEITRLDNQQSTTDKDIAFGLTRLAFGCVSDAVSLLFKDEVTDSDLEKMDLFNVSEIKRKKNGEMEIKFFDRLKALEKLTDITDMSSSDEENSIFHAIAKGAAALRNENYE